MEPTLYNDAMPAATSAGLMGLSMFWMLFMLVLIIVSIVASWKIFVKAGKPGWASLIPFYNIYVMLQISGMSGWWLLAFFVPFLNVVAAILFAINLAHAFGKSTAYGIFLLFIFNVIGMLMLGFGDAKYLGSQETKPVPAKA